jgi:hypothetical protein
MNRLANVETITANIAGLKRMILRFRLLMQTQFNPSHLAKYTVGVGRTYL